MDKELFLSKVQVGSITVEVYEVTIDDEPPYNRYTIILEDGQTLTLNDYEFENLQTITKMLSVYVV